MKSCKLCWALAAVLAVVVAAFAYRVLVGKVAPSADGRTTVLLTKDERNLVLLEMRAWLQNSQAILDAASRKDAAGVVTAARASGMGAEAGTPGSLLVKIPADMKKLGFGTRQQFDAIAADAEKTGDSQRALAQLAEAMKSCVACHAAYRLADAGE